MSLLVDLPGPDAELALVVRPALHDVRRRVAHLRGDVDAAADAADGAHGHGGQYRARRVHGRPRDWRLDGGPAHDPGLAAPPNVCAARGDDRADRHRVAPGAARGPAGRAVGAP